MKKNDNPLQMAEVPQTMAEIRAGWLELRELAVINLSLDHPSLERIYSSAPRCWTDIRAICSRTSRTA